MGELIAIFIAILLNWATPLSPIHILWINLVTDSFPALALGVDPNDKDVMDSKPRNSKESIFSGEVLNVAGNGALIAVITLVAFRIGYTNYPDSLTHAQTMAFLVMSISELIHSLNMRNKRKSIFTIGFFTNKYLIYSIVLGLLLQVILVFTPGLNTLFKITPLNLNDWIIVLALSIVPLVINELVKLIKRIAK
jgi:Ca2+-transporting ATPase